MPSVFIVDDDLKIRTLITSFLKSTSPFKVCEEAESAAQAIEKAPELKPDVILLDLVMSGLNGIQAASVLRGLLPKTKIILFTFFDDIPGQALAIAVGVDAILSKSDGLTGISQTLQKVMAKTIEPEILAVNTTETLQKVPSVDN